jgi:hypothetical protein
LINKQVAFLTYARYSKLQYKTANLLGISVGISIQIKATCKISLNLSTHCTFIFQPKYKQKLSVFLRWQPHVRLISSQFQTRPLLCRLVRSLSHLQVLLVKRHCLCESSSGSHQTSSKLFIPIVVSRHRDKKMLKELGK